MDGPFVVDPESRDMMVLSLSRAMVQTDDVGNARLVKRGTHSDGKDDIAAALTLAAGAWDRSPTKQQTLSGRRFWYDDSGAPKLRNLRGPDLHFLWADGLAGAAGPQAAMAASGNLTGQP